MKTVKMAHFWGVGVGVGGGTQVHLWLIYAVVWQKQT